MNKFYSSIFFLLLVTICYGQTREKSFPSYYIGSPFYVIDPLELIEDALTITRTSNTSYVLKAVSGNEKKIEANISFVGKADNKGINYNKYSGRGYLNEEPKNLIIYSERPLDQFLEGKGHLLYSEEKLESFIIHITHSPLWEDKDYPKERIIVVPIKEHIDSDYIQKGEQKILNFNYLRAQQKSSSSITGIYTSKKGNKLELLELKDGRVVYRLDLFNGIDLGSSEGIVEKSEEAIYSSAGNSSCIFKITIQQGVKLEVLEEKCPLWKKFDFEGIYKSSWEDDLPDQN